MPGNFYALTTADILKWPTPNYDNPTDTRNWLPAFAITWQAVTTVLAVGRFYLRASRKAGAWGLDDTFILIGWLGSIALTVLACLDGYLYGVNRHTWDVPPDLYWKAAFTAWLAQISFIFATFGIKLSVLLFHRRMVKDAISRSWIYVIWFFIWVTIMAYVAAFIVYCFMCQPLEAYWLYYRFVPAYTTKFTCVDGQQLDLAVAVILGLSDIWSVAIPIAMLRHYNLDVSRRQKIALNGIFCLGFLAFGAGIARSYYLWQIDHTPDLFWTGFDLYVWSLTECHLGIVCACLPSLRAFFRYYFGDPARRTNTSATRSADNSAFRESRRWSKRNTKDSWVTEMSAVRNARDFPPHSPIDAREKNSAEITLAPKHSIEDMG